MNKKVVAIVPAAGLGKRFGACSNKAFVELNGKPVIIRTLEIFEDVDEVGEVIPVFKEGGDMEQGCDLIIRYNLSKVKRVAAGGRERQDSVYNGLNSAGDNTNIVLIHDGVRPLIEESLVKESIRQIRGFDGVVVGVPPKDTIKKVQNSHLGGSPMATRSKVQSEIVVQKTLDRELLWAVQTPQVFKYASLMSAYKKAMADGVYSTDDSALVERCGGKIKIIMGSYENIKITTPEDMTIAEMILRNRRA